MPLKIIKKTGTATVTKDAINNKAKTSTEVAKTQEQVPVPLNDAQVQGVPCTIGFEASYTKNLGNYESTRIGITLTIPCRHDEIDSVYDFAQEWVNAKMGKCVDDLTAEE